MKKRPRVVLLVETSNSYCRELLKGIYAYIQENGPWSTFLTEQARGDPSHGPVPCAAIPFPRRASTHARPGGEREHGSNVHPLRMARRAPEGGSIGRLPAPTVGGRELAARR